MVTHSVQTSFNKIITKRIQKRYLRSFVLNNESRMKLISSLDLFLFWSSKLDFNAISSYDVITCRIARLLCRC